MTQARRHAFKGFEEGRGFDYVSSAGIGRAAVSLPDPCAEQPFRACAVTRSVLMLFTLLQRIQDGCCERSGAERSPSPRTWTTTSGQHYRVAGHLYSRERIREVALLQMAEPRKVSFVTLSAFTAAPPPGSDARKRRLDADTEPSLSPEPILGAPEAAGSGKAPGQSETMRINITLPESTELSFPEFSYSELLQETESGAPPLQSVQPC
ncbi:hypothetical protein PDJAM_G00260070 [Pangasius djambal]|nr:hypothetical protein [Pangasius djambal]